MGVSAAEFKGALGQWPSGVTVVSSHFEGAHRAMTVSAFASVSLEPALISVCLSNDSLTLGIIRSSQRFGVSVLSQVQSLVSDRCAANDRDGLDDVKHFLGINGCALVEDAAAQLECDVHQLVAAGDHALVIGVVTRSIVSDRAPLVYCRRSYGSFAPSLR